MMFNALLSALCRHLSLPQEYLHGDGLDIPVGAFSLHVRQRDQLVTLFIALGDVQATSLANMADWPVLQLSCTDEHTTLLWAREWLDKLDLEIMVDLISRMLHQAEALTMESPPLTAFASCQPSAAIRG